MKLEVTCWLIKCDIEDCTRQLHMSVGDSLETSERRWVEMGNFVEDHGKHRYHICSYHRNYVAATSRPLNL